MKQKVQGLNKQFKEKDVQRLRNLITGKHGAKTTTSIGYTKAEEFHKEGDIWESDGRTWTIKDGIKQNITKLDKAKKAHVIPLLCPCCKKVMKKRIDKPTYNLHKKCFDCQALVEHEIRKSGKWEEYTHKLHNDYIDHNIDELEKFIKYKLKEGNKSFVTEDGDIEKWVGKLDKEKVEEYLKSVKKYATALKK
tara:strand:- start:1078 stop:1656 length:579 start_codon:yes stop_codon:yes gene_type:complete